MRSNDDLFLNCFPDATFYMFLSTLTENYPKRSPNGTTLLRKNRVFFDSFPKSSPTGPQGGSRPPKRHQNGAPGHQNGVPGPLKFGFWDPKSCWKEAGGLCFQITKKRCLKKKVRVWSFRITNKKGCQELNIIIDPLIHIQYDRCIHSGKTSCFIHPYHNAKFPTCELHRVQRLRKPRSTGVNHVFIELWLRH